MDDSLSGEDVGEGQEEALVTPPTQRPQTDSKGRFAKGNTLRRDHTQPVVGKLDEEEWKEAFVQDLMVVWTEMGKAGVRKAFREKPRDYIDLMAKVTKVTDRVQEIRVLKIMAVRAMPPDDWQPELYDESNDTNATDQLLSEPPNPSGATVKADSGVTDTTGGSK